MTEPRHDLGSRALVPAVAVLSMALLGATCGDSQTSSRPMDTEPAARGSAASPAPAPADPGTGTAGGAESAIFAGGCFWCMEPPYDKLDGVLATTSGYIGGEEVDPTYKQVSSGQTGHTEAVEVTYDPSKISYAELLRVFWINIDPTVDNRQFCDWGSQYRTGIFPLNDEQKRLAEASKQEIVDSGRFENVYTEVTPATAFYPAEEYHQDFYKKNPGHYKRYREGCGRDRRLAELWGEEMKGKGK